jgi:CheY-like chemotaxis protein
LEDKKPKMLLADPSASVRKVVELAFADEGIEVYATGDAQAAMHKFVEVQPDIVLVDVELAGTSGYQICEMIKQDDATKEIPVLLLVGSFVPFDQDQAERVQADGFVTKPFHSVRDLVLRVNELLGREVAVPVGVPAAASGQPETADIEDLYRDSFAVTAEIEEFDTLEDLLSDAGLDDELIETSKPAVDDGIEEFVPVTELATPVGGAVPAAGAAEFPPPNERAVPKFVFENAPERRVSQGSTTESLRPDELIKDLSPELIDKIANVVIDRLSDGIVREVAREAVPRIAEKLMREALDAENKQK